MITYNLEIKKIRQLSELTQSDFAASLGISLRTLQNYEAKSKVPVNVSKLISMKYGDLIRRYDIPNEAFDEQFTSINSSSLDVDMLTEELRFLRKMRDLQQKKIEKLESQIEELKSNQ